MHTKLAPVPPAADGLSYPFETVPRPDQAIEVAPGLFWVRLALPFRLNHVNVYLIADGDGWTLVDTGIGNEATVAAWTALFEGALAGFDITRLIVTHAHPDHIGLAGWLVRRFGCPLHMSQVEYLNAAYHQTGDTEERRQNQREFFRIHGMDDAVTNELLGRGQDYLRRVWTLPPAYRRLANGDEIAIGRRTFRVITGGGHGLDQVMLFSAADRLFLSADQVLSKISPNVSVWATEPEADALGEYLHSLDGLTTLLPDDVLVLPGHGVPFYGVKTRIGQLADHHEDRCRLIAEACAQTPRTTAELVPVVFHKHVLDPHQTGFAAGEVIAHVNYMLRRGRLGIVGQPDGVMRFASH